MRGQRLCVEENVGVEVAYVAACACMGERTKLNGKGGTSLMKAEGCTEWINP
jgi:hypothetical protein